MGKQPTIGLWIRSILFYVFSVLGFIPFLFCFPVLFLPRRFIYALARLYLTFQIFLLRRLNGISYEVDGRKHLPDGACLIAAQHESAWETIFFNLLLDQPVMLAKKELFRIPLVNWIMRKLGHVSLDRQGPADKIRDSFQDAVNATQQGRKLLIFPSGTRKPAGHGRVKSGIGVLYSLTELPVLPVLLNSGQCWPAQSLLKFPGRITVRILPPIVPGLDRQVFMDELQSKLSQTI